MFAILATGSALTGGNRLDDGETVAPKKEPGLCDGPHNMRSKGRRHANGTIR